MGRTPQFVVTGATGFVGLQLVPKLGDQRELLIVSRNPDEAALRFPAAKICSYDELAGQDFAGATFVHLAVRNNDQPGALEDFQAANVIFLMEVATIAKEGGAGRFINLCSTHALEPNPEDLYGRSKREGAIRLRTFWPDGAVNLYVPAIYGERFGGRLGFIDRLPKLTQSPTLALLGLLKPILSIDCLCDALRAISRSPDVLRADEKRGELYLADPVPEFGVYAASKRAIDLSVAIGVIVLAGWAMILIALYIRLDSKGPSIFTQKRIGKNAKIFTCFKFRTMTVGTNDAATHDISADCVTKAGHFLRRTKLDELPQVVNILRNEMSLVGPRPSLPIQHELIERRTARAVLTLKPGITGLAQINDVDMSDPARLAALDDRYRAFRTLIGDAMILIRTVLGGGAGDRIRRENHG